MAYGLSTRTFIEDGPVEQVSRASALRSTARSWRALNPDSRLAAIERALHPANDQAGALPFAI